MKNKNLPNKISIFPLSNVIFFPKTILPLNIFEQRYLDMVNDSYENEKFIGMIQPKNKNDLFEIGCLGKITNFNKTKDNRILINLVGVSRFKIQTEVKNTKLYRECFVSYENFSSDIESKELLEKKDDLKELKNNIKIIYKRNGILIDWQETESLSLIELINTISMISPFSYQEKQSLLEAENVKIRIKILKDITNIYLADKFSNNTLQ